MKFQACILSGLLLGACADPAAASEPLSAPRQPLFRGRVALSTESAPNRARVRILAIESSGATRVHALPNIEGSGMFSATLPSAGGLVEVSAEGFQRQLRWLKAPPAGVANFQLTRAVLSDPAVRRNGGAILRGQVVDEEGRLVSGALLGISRLDFKNFRATPVPFLLPGEEQAMEMRTGSSGTFSLAVRERVETPAADGAGFVVTCVVPGFAKASLPIQPRSDIQELQFHLKRQFTKLAGRIVDQEGKACGSVPLTILVPAPGGAPFFEMIRTNQDGRFSSLEHIPVAPQYWLLVDDPDHMPMAKEIAYEQRGNVELKLAKGSDLLVKVQNAETQASLSTALVSIQVPIEPMALVRIAEREEGKYRLRNLPPASVASVFASCEDYSTETSTVQAGLVSAPPAEVTLLLKPACKIVGKVLDEQNRPVPGAHLVVSAEKTLLSAYSNHAGSFRLEGLLPGLVGRVECKAPGYAPWWKDALLIQNQELEIRLEAGASVRGRVVAEDGSPLPKVRLRALRVTQDPENPKVFTCAVTAQKEALTDDQGTYALTGLAEGNYLIAPVLDGKSEMVGNPARYEVAPPMPLRSGDQLLDFEFRMAVPGSIHFDFSEHSEAATKENPPHVTFYERGKDGKEAFFGAQITRTAKLTPDGLWQVAPIVPGRYDLEVRVNGYIPARFEEIEVKSGLPSRVTLDKLSSGSELRLRVVDEAGLAWPGVSVKLFRVTSNDIIPGHTTTLLEIPEENPSLVSISADDAGNASIPNLEKGRYQLHVTDGKGPYAYQRFDISGSEEKVYKTLLLARGFEGRFRIRNEQGESIPRASLILTRIEQDFEGIKLSAITNDSGECKIPHLKAGPYKVEVFAVDAHEARLLRNQHYEQFLVIQDDGSERTLSFQ